MGTYGEMVVFISFGTKGYEATLDPIRHNRWEAYIAGLLRNKRARLLNFLFHEDHLHVLLALHPTLSVADLVKDIKLASTHVFKKEKWFPRFGGWQRGYFFLSVDPLDEDTWHSFFQETEAWHTHSTYAEELIQLLKRYQIDFEWTHLFRE